MPSLPRPARDLADVRTPRGWCDRLGSVHVERSAQVPVHDAEVPRVRSWVRSGDDEGDSPVVLVGELARRAHGGEPNPLVSPDPAGDEGVRLYTWIVEDSRASAVLLWINGLFDHTDVRRSELERLGGPGPDGDLWSITLRLPADWTGSYRIAAHHGAGEAPWRVAGDRRSVRLAALQAGALDPRGTEVLTGSAAECSSVASGPDAHLDAWRTSSASDGATVVGDGAETTATIARGRVDPLEFPADGAHPSERAWVYRPAAALAGVARRTPLLVVFDGQVWNDGLGLPGVLDTLIARGQLAPIHVVLVDSRDQDTRWARLGVPGGQVDTVLDRILPHVRANYPVSPRGRDTAVAGQSLGGLAALWTLALGEGRIDHAIAQSPSLWRFPMAGPLLREPRWQSVRLHAGTFEGAVLEDARDLAVRLSFDPLADSRSITVRPVHGGHDWAWWRAALVDELVDLFPLLPVLPASGSTPAS